MGNIEISAPSGSATLDLVTSTGGISTIQTRRSMGSVASPLAIDTTRGLLNISIQGYDGSAWSNGAVISSVAGAAWSGSSHSANIKFSTTAIGSTTLTQALLIQPSQGVVVGNNSVDPGSGNLWLEAASGSNSFRNYRSLTDSSNGDWFEQTFSGTTAILGTNKNGTGSALSLALETAGVTALFVDTSSPPKVGIGNTSPTSLLTIGSSTARGTLKVSGTAAANPAIQIDNTNFSGGAAWNLNVGADTATGLSFISSGTKVIFDTSLVTFNTAISAPMEYLTPQTPPSSPGSGWVLYVDSGDSNKLKAKASTGTVVTLGTP